MSQFKTRLARYMRHLSKREKVVFIGVFVALILGLFSSTCLGYRVSIDDQTIGYTKNTELFTGSVRNIEKDLQSKYGIDSLYIAEDIKVTRSVVVNRPVIDEEVLANSLLARDLKVGVHGATLVVNGNEVGSFTSKEQAEAAITDSIKKSGKLKKHDHLVSYEIAEDIKIESKDFSVSEVRTTDGWSDFLLTGKMPKTESMISDKINKNNEGEMQLANRSGAEMVREVEQPEEAAPQVQTSEEASAETTGEATNVEENINPNTQDGTEINSGILKIGVVKRSVLNEVIPYEVEVREDPNLYVGKEEIIQPGVEGIRDKEIEYSYKDGKVVEEKVLSEKIAAEFVKQIVAKGVKQYPTMHSIKGDFILPANGDISAIDKPGSHAGGRAVDIAGSSGSPIYAPADGVVTMASSYGGYGETIQIDHGNGYTTLIGHLSAYNVKVGDKVTMGQVIGARGNTGNSSGPHAHFEIRLNGAQVVITEYFNIREGMFV